MSTKTRKPTRIDPSERVRRELVASTKSLRRVEKETGIPVSVLSRFMRRGTVNSKTIDRLCCYFGLTLTSFFSEPDKSLAE